MKSIHLYGDKKGEESYLVTEIEKKNAKKMFKKDTTFKNFAEDEDEDSKAAQLTHKPKKEKKNLN